MIAGRHHSIQSRTPEVCFSLLRNTMASQPIISTVTRCKIHKRNNENAKANTILHNTSTGSLVPNDFFTGSCSGKNMGSFGIQYIHPSVNTPATGNRSVAKAGSAPRQSSRKPHFTASQDHTPPPICFRTVNTANKRSAREYHHEKMQVTGAVSPF
jgi:hypothetical protein